MSHPAEPTALHAAAHEHEHEHGGTGVYAKTLIGLLILTAITVAAASFDFGQGNVVIALIIATIKASLVVLFFMHLRWDKPVNAVIAMAGFLFLGIFIVFVRRALSHDSRPRPVDTRSQPT